MAAVWVNPKSNSLNGPYQTFVIVCGERAIFFLGKLCIILVQSREQWAATTHWEGLQVQQAHAEY